MCEVPSKISTEALRGAALGLALLFAAACTPPGAEPAPSSAASSASSDAGAGAEATLGTDLRRVPAPKDLPRDRALQVGFLVVDGVYNTELTAPYDIFQHTVFHAPPGMEVFTVSPDGAAITTFEGLRLRPHHSFETVPPIDVLVVPSAEHSMDSDLENEVMMAWVREVGGKARFIVSLCDGAFVLAEAGLLDGLAVTTFPGDQDRFAERFPHLDLRRGVSFVHDGKAVTSWGGARSFDPAMYLVDHLYGEKATQGIGRGMVIPWPPAPGVMPAVVIEP